MPEDLEGAPGGTTPPAQGGLPAASDDLLQDPSALQDLPPDEEAIPHDVAALQEEVRQLRSLKGRLGNEKGQLLREREEAHRRAEEYRDLLTRQSAQQPQQPQTPADPWQERDQQWFQTRVEDLTEDVADRLRLAAYARGEDPDEEGIQRQAQARAQQKAAREYQDRLAERQFHQKREEERQKQERERRDALAQANDFVPFVERVLPMLPADERPPDVTAADIGTALRQKGVTLSYFESLDPTAQAGLTATVSWEVFGRKMAAKSRQIPSATAARASVPPPPANPAPVAGARTEAANTPPPDSEVEAKFASYRARLDPLAVPDERVRAMAQAAVEQERREKALGLA